MMSSFCAGVARANTAPVRVAWVVGGQGPAVDHFVVGADDADGDGDGAGRRGVVAGDQDGVMPAA